MELNKREFSPGELICVLLRRFYIVALAAVLFAGLLVGYTKWSYQPSYQSMASLYMIGGQAETDDSELAMYMTSRIAEECLAVMTSRSVLEQVVDTLDLEDTLDQLWERMSIQRHEDTRIFYITALADTPEEAKAIADALAEVGAREVVSHLDVVGLEVIDDGSLAEEPEDGPSYKKRAVLGGVLGAGVSAVILMALHMIDDTVRKPEDLEAMDLRVLGVVPRGKKEKQSAMGKSGRRA